MKNLLFPVILLILSSSVQAQLPIIHKLEAAKNSATQKQVIFKPKAPTDTLYYEDFSGGFPSNLSLQNNAGNSNNWIWSNAAPGGQYSTSVAAINSTSAANGFMSLPSGFFNTPFPPGGPVAMDASFTIGPISINPKLAVDIRWQQSSRYCCQASNELVLEVSADGITYTTFDAVLGRAPNVSMPDPSSDPAEQVRINVSSVLSNQSTAYIRFRKTGSTHYYWMIDDLLITEGYTDLMILENHQALFTMGLPYKKIPNLLFDSLSFDLFSKNDGYNTQSGVHAKLDVFQDSLLNGQPGIGFISSVSTTFGPPVPFQQQISFKLGPYLNQLNSTGFYTAKIEVKSNVPSLWPKAAQANYQFEVTDSVLSRVGHESGFIGDVGTSGFPSGAFRGNRFASLFSVGSNLTTLSSASFYVSRDSANAGSYIRAQVWNWNPQASTISAAINPLLAVSDSMLIDSTHLGTWITLPLLNPVNLSPKSQVVVGWEQLGNAQQSGSEFSVGRDRSLESFQPFVSNFLYINGTSPGWGWVNQLPAIRLNFALPVGLSKEQKEQALFSIFPNPNAGLFTLRFQVQEANSYQLKIRNNLGQVVLNEQVDMQTNFSKSIDLREYDSGIYLVSLEREGKRFVQKLVVQ